MSFNASAISPIYSNRVRKISLGATIALIVTTGVNLILRHPFINLHILLWLISFCLICVNFSKLGVNRKQDHLARYTSLKLTLSFVFAVLMGTSLVHIFNNLAWWNSANLFIVLVANAVFLVSHYAFYYFGIEEKGRIGERL